MRSEISYILENSFDWWSAVKQRVNERERVGFYEGEIWWIHLGLNIGVESNGKNINLTRPVLILKKYNSHSFLSVPLSTSEKSNDYRLPIGEVGGKTASVIISQLRYLDSKRLFKKICAVDYGKLIYLKRKASEINFR